MKDAKNGKTPLREIPGVGKRTELDLLALGYDCVESLAEADPQEIFDRDCIRRGEQIDRCQLYVYRCAVAYANTQSPERDSFRWWHFSDESLGKPQQK